MKNKSGFIAISLIYSFFLVFLMTLLVIMTTYAHNRLLLNDVKKTIKEKLNSLSVLETFNLENKSYNVAEEVTYANESWVVIKDNTDSATLVLNRNLTKDELQAPFDSAFINALNTGNNESIRMCANVDPDNYSHSYCFSNAVDAHKPYTWGDSLVKQVIDGWLSSNEILSKAIARGKLNNMNFSDGSGNAPYYNQYNSFIRIMTAEEYEDFPESLPHMWLIDKVDASVIDVKCTINNKNIGDCKTYTIEKSVRPVIEVKKLKQSD